MQINPPPQFIIIIVTQLKFSSLAGNMQDGKLQAEHKGILLSTSIQCFLKKVTV